ncbi:MAG TPA: hypothetical protein VFP49_08880 [Nitrososphaeraceae archaeon]|jgi:hypothetical protein|nr:hypothetical protein [Nitrososphaeraceae archaeon]
MIRIQIVISRKTISISEENHSELTKLGVSGETIDDISKKMYGVYKKIDQEMSKDELIKGIIVN